MTKEIIEKLQSLTLLYAEDEEGISVPRWVNDGVIIKNQDENGKSRYDF